MSISLFSHGTTYEHPYDTIIAELHAKLPRISYITNVFPGNRPGWMLRRAEDIRSLLQDSTHFIKKGFGRWAQGIGEDWLVIPTELDPPTHGLFRETLNPHFAPKKMEAMSQRMRERARALIGRFKDRGACDFIEAFSASYPTNIVLDLLGLPADRLPQFLEWERNLVHTSDVALRSSTTRAVKDYLLHEIESRRRAPRDDYISRMLNFEAGGRRWTEDEVFGHCFNLYLGGLDTVTAELGWQFHHLATHPEQQRELRANPALCVVAVEEMLRAFAPVTSFRIVAEPLEFCGVSMLPGDYVGFPTALAGRDPTAYEAPGEVRFDRKPSHLTLGAGIHKCLGMHLARLELQIAVEEFLAAIPEFRLKDGFKTPFYLGNILHVRELHLAWN
jgi:cytochrome P450